MNHEKNKFLTVSWLRGLLSADIFIRTGEWGVQMPPLTSENSHFLRSGPQEATLVMNRYIFRVRSWNDIHKLYSFPDSSFLIVFTIYTPL